MTNKFRYDFGEHYFLLEVGFNLARLDLIYNNATFTKVPGTEESLFNVQNGIISDINDALTPTGITLNTTLATFEKLSKDFLRKITQSGGSLYFTFIMMGMALARSSFARGGSQQQYDDLTYLAKTCVLSIPNEIIPDKEHFFNEFLARNLENITELSDFLTSWSNESEIDKTLLESKFDIDIFISHSSHDVELAKLLIDLIRSAIRSPSLKIRCTSVDGYRLPAGANTSEQLKVEVNVCKILIGLVSGNSINSAYVLFELGARWGLSKPLIPIIFGENGTSFLKGPLSSINALNISSQPQVYQLITELGNLLDMPCEPPAMFIDKVNAVSNYS